MEENLTEKAVETTENPQSGAANESELATVIDPELKDEKTKAAEKAQKRKLSTLRWLVISGAIILSGLLRALSVHCFVIPHNFAPGGATGVATMLQSATGINSGIWMLAINAPLLIAAFFLITKRFAIITAISIGIQSGLLLLFEKVNVPVYADNSILAAVAGGIVGGAGIGILLKVGGSSGGTDIIATYVYKHFSAASVSWFIFALDSVVVFISFFVFRQGLTPVLLALTEMFASARSNDLIVNGFKSSLKFEIITTSPDALSKEIIEKLHRGVTVIAAKGAYTGADKSMLVCLIRRSQLSAFRKILAHYPDTFAYISTTNEVMGRGFMSKIL